MSGYWFYAFLGLVTASLRARGLPSGPTAMIAVGLVNTLALGFWLAMARLLRSTSGSMRSIVARFLVTSPLTYLGGLIGGCWIFSR